MVRTKDPPTVKLDQAIRSGLRTDRTRTGLDTDQVNFLSRTDEDRKVRGSLDGIWISLLGQIINRKKKSSRKAKYHWTQQTKFRARREINANSIEKLRNLKMEADAADPATGAMVEIDDESFF